MREKMSRPRSSVPRRWWSPGPTLMALKFSFNGLGSGKTLAKMAPKRLRPTQATQIQKNSPSGSLFSGFSTIRAASSRLTLLTADPGIDDIDDEVEEEVDGDHQHRHGEHDALDDQEVTLVDRQDQGITEARYLEEVLDHESGRQQTPDVDTRGSEQRDRRRTKGVAPHDAPLAESLGARHRNELLLECRDEVAAQHAVVDHETDRGEGE